MLDLHKPYWQPRPYRCINGVWPKRKVGHPIWRNNLIRPGFDTDYPGERAQENFFRRAREPKKPTYYARRLARIEGVGHALRTGWWPRLIIARTPIIMQAKRGIMPL